MSEKDFEVGDKVKVFRFDKSDIGEGVIQRIEEEKHHIHDPVNLYFVRLENGSTVKVYRYALQRR